MISKNNIQYRRQQEARRTPHYGLRKLSVGVASVLLSTTLYLGLNTNAQADTTDGASPSGTDTSDPNAGALSNQDSVTLTSHSSETAAASSAADTAGTDHDQPAPSTTQPSRVNNTGATSQEGPWVAELDDGATVSIDHNVIGAVKDADQINVTIHIANANAGDRYVLQIPKGQAYDIDNPSGQHLTVSGTTTVLNDENGLQFIDKITGTVTGSTAITQVITLKRRTGYANQGEVLSEIGEVLKQITFTKTAADGTKSEKQLTFTQVIDPEMGPTFNRSKPQASANKGVLTNVDYTYSLAINETIGAEPGSKKTVKQVNAAVNSGTKITIPVPEGFVLNQELTNQANVNDKGAFPDITQPGGKGNAIIINIPKGQGVRGWADLPYMLVGHYDIATPTKDTVLTATDQITVDQTVTKADGSTYQLIKKVGPWSETLLGISPDTDTGIIAKPNTAAQGYQELNSGETSSQLPLAADSSKPLAYFSFGNPSITSSTTSQVTLNIADGLNINRITTPKDDQYLPGTTSYTYTATLSDGSTITGKAAAGTDVASPEGLFIRKITFSPNYIASGANQAFNGTANLSNSTAFLAYGSIAKTLADGTPVKEGTVLDSAITFTYQTLLGNKTVTSTSTSTASQVISEPYSYLIASMSQSGKAPGKADAGRVYLTTNTGISKTTDYVHEPIFYFVLPAAAQADLTGFALGQGAPKVTSKVVGDRQVVKVDYTGTNFDYNTTKASNSLTLNNLPFAASGSYPWEVYLYSPTTKIDESTDKPASTQADFNPAFTDGQTDRVYLVANGTWIISSAAETGTTTAATGNQNNGMMVVQAGSDDKGTGQMALHFAVRNGQSTAINNAVAVVNLSNPDHFQMSGPITTATGDQNAYLYSTHSYDKPVGTTAGAQADLTGYVTADQIKDWSQVKSIAIKLADIAADTSSKVFTIKGADPTITQDAGEKIGLETILFTTNMKPAVADADNNAAITVNGSSTITAEVVDATGKVVLQLPNLTHNYDDNQDLVKQDDFALTDDNKAEINKILEKLNNNQQGVVYALDATPTVKNGQKTWATDAPNGTAAFGQTARYDFDTDVVQYHISSQSQLSYEIVDQTTGQKLVVNHPLATGSKGTALGNDTKDAYQKAIQDYLDQGYVLVAQDKLPDSFGDQSQLLTVTLAHGVATITPDTPAAGVPGNSPVQPTDLTKTAKLKVVYQNADGTNFTGTRPANADQVVTLTGTAYVDKVTGKLTNKPVTSSNIVDSGNTATPAIAWTTGKTALVKSPAEAGYTADAESIPALSIAVGPADSGLTAGNAVVIGQANKEVAITRTVTYDSKQQQIDYTIIDDTTGTTLVPSTMLVNGKSGATVPAAASASLKDIVSRYLQAGYVQKGDYSVPHAFDTDEHTNQLVTIHLAHGSLTVDQDHPGQPGTKLNPGDQRQDAPTYPAGSDQVTSTVTRTIHYTGAGDQTPADQPQTVQFKATGYLDRVTGKWIVSPTDFTEANGPVWSGDGSLSAVVPSTVPGYHIVNIDRDGDGLDKVNGVTVNHATKDYTVTVNYAKTPTAEVVYLDTENNDQQLAASPLLSGVAGKPIAYDTAKTVGELESKGYVVLENGFDPAGTAPVFAADDTETQRYLVKLGHRVVKVTPDAPLAM